MYGRAHVNRSVMNMDNRACKVKVSFFIDLLELSIHVQYKVNNIGNNVDLRFSRKTIEFMSRLIYVVSYVTVNEKIRNIYLGSIFFCSTPRVVSQYSLPGTPIINTQIIQM